MNTICPFCNKDNTTPFSDIKTKEFGYTCLDCKKDFGVFTSETLDSFISNIKKMNISYSISSKIYSFGFIKKNNKVSLKIDSYIDSIHNDYDEIDFTSLFENFISILLNQMFILDIVDSNIDKKKDYFILEIEGETKIIKKTNNFNYYLDLVTSLMFQLIGSEK